MSDQTSEKSQTSKSISERMLSAIETVLHSAYMQGGYESDGKFFKRYTKYVQSINSAYSKNGKARSIAKWIVPDEDAYNKKTTEYPNYYKDELLTSLLKFLELCREIALAPQQNKPKNYRIPSKDEADSLMDEIFGRKNKK